MQRRQNTCLFANQILYENNENEPRIKLSVRLASHTEGLLDYILQMNSSHPNNFCITRANMTCFYWKKNTRKLHRNIYRYLMHRLSRTITGSALFRYCTSCSLSIISSTLLMDLRISYGWISKLVVYVLLMNTNMMLSMMLSAIQYQQSTLYGAFKCCL